MKFAVGVMLSSFGMFWGGEGAGASWPGGDAALLVIIPGVFLTAITLSKTLTRSLSLASTEYAGSSPADIDDHARVSP